MVLVVTHLKPNVLCVWRSACAKDDQANIMQRLLAISVLVGHRVLSIALLGDPAVQEWQQSASQAQCIHAQSASMSQWDVHSAKQP